MSKVIFLNIKGVLTNAEHTRKLKKRGVVDQSKYIDPTSFDLLCKLQKITGAKIMVISNEYIKDPNKMTPLVQKMRSKGIKIYSLNKENPYDDLCESINRYLEKNEKNIDAYIVLDSVFSPYDSKDYPLSEHYMRDSIAENMILTRSGVNNVKEGFSYKHFDKALKILMGEDYIYEEGMEETKL